MGFTRLYAARLAGDRLSHVNTRNDAQDFALPDNAEGAGRRYREIEERLVTEILRAAPSKWPRDWAKKAFLRLRGTAKVSDEEQVLLYTWLTWHAEHADGVTLASVFRKKKGATLPESERLWFEAQMDAWLSIVEVLAVRPGEGMRVRDLLTGREWVAFERSGTRNLRPHDFLLARMLEFEGVGFMGCCHPRVLPPNAGRPLAEAMREYCGLENDDEVVAPESLRSEEITATLICEWEDEVGFLMERPLPTLVNSAGQALVFTRDRFDVRPEDRGKVLAALRSIPGASEEPPVRGQGPSDVPRIDFVSPGEERIVEGSAELRPKWLLLATNSVERADALRASVEKACGDLVRHRVRDHEDPAASLSNPGRQRAALPEVPPEMAAALRAHKEKHYASWVDESVPALGGKTPRNAMKTPAGRKAVEALLAEIEHAEARLPENQRYDVGILRAALGLG